MSAEISVAEPFDVHISSEMLDDLHRRLVHARIAPDYVNEDWSYGVEGGYLTELVGYWRDRFDWRAAERLINERAHFRTEIDGIPVHFIHERGKGPKPMPLVLTHGWPWTFWEYRKMIGPLTDPAAFGGDPADAFDVVVPSMPGYGFSTPLTRPGVTVWSIADMWVTLMVDVLGYERFGAHGGDNGASTTAQLGHKYADRLIGIHMAPGPHTLAIWNLDRPWADLTSGFLPTDPAVREGLIEWEKTVISHAVVHALDPQTLAYGLYDSPVGLLAWLLERHRSWSDCGGDVESVFSKDDLLTTAMLYWATGTIGTSARLYRENWLSGWTPSHDRSPVVEAPTAVSLFLAHAPPGMPTDWMSDYYNLQFLRVQEDGGHFAPLERPDVLVDHLREFFRPLRSG